LIVFNVTASDGTNPSGRSKTATLTLPAALVTKAPSKYQVCYEDASGARFLAACPPKVPDTAPACILSKGLNKLKDLVIVIRAPFGDPKLQF
jgi:hypothetical protein